MDVFVYGTLTDPETAGDVLETFDYCGRAELLGLHRVEGRYPTLAPGGRTTGRLLRTPDRTSLDRYEGVDSGLYVRVSVPLSDSDDAASTDTVAVYVGDPERLDASAEWDGDGQFRERVTQHLDDTDVRVRLTRSI